MEKYSLLIDGAASTGNCYEVRSPFDGRPIAQIEKADSRAVEHALENARESYENIMKQMPAWQRAEILYKVSDMMKARSEELSMTIALEGGKPLKDARAEVTRAIGTVKMSGDEALRLCGEQISMDRAKGSESHIAFTIVEGVGPVLAISAFNHPVNLICHQVATAIAGGNSVLVKPASQTPISCLKIAQMFYEAGLPPKALSVLTISGSEADKIVSDSRLKFISFIGGGDVGWEMRKKIAPGCRISLEHGGTAVCVVDDSAALSKAVPGITKGGFYHAGQVCVSTQNVYVHEDKIDDFLFEFIKSVKKLITGDPTDPSTDVGPIISKFDMERIGSWVNEAISEGATVLTGGKALSDSLYEPTILLHVKPGMKVFSREIFGPVVNVMPYRNIEDVIKETNATAFSFQSAIYSQDIDTAMKYCRKIESKACIINDHTAFRVDWMPFGGTKDSGLGVGGVKYSIRDVTEEKLIVIKSE